MPGLALTDFFHGPMVVADVHVEADDLFTLQGNNIAHQTVGTHVMGADIQYEMRLTVGFLHVNPAI